MRKSLQFCEDDKKYILSQCKDGLADPLLMQFRADQICKAYTVFQSKGISLKDLFEWQKRYPLIFPWNSEYEALKSAANRRAIFFPVVIVMAKKIKHLIFALELAKKCSLEIALRSGGHNFEGLCACDGMIIDQSLRHKIKILPPLAENKGKDQKFTVQPGTSIGSLVLKLHDSGLSIPTGTCSQVNVTGLTLGGGIGFLNRKFGLTCDNLTEVEILLASGKLVTANKEKYSDLFWASQGGGGANFGIVTSLTYQGHYIEEVSRFEITYPFEYFRPVFRLFETYVFHPDNDLTTEFKTHGQKSVVIMSGLYLGSSEKLKLLLQPLLQIEGVDYEKVKVEIAESSYLDACRYFTGTGRWLPFFKIKNGFIGKKPEDILPEEGVDIMIEYMSGIHGELDSNILELSSLGGRVAEIGAQETAFPHRQSKYWILFNAHWNKQSQERSQLKWANEFYAKLSPFFSGSYVNGTDLDEPQALENYYAINLARLIEIKKKYDPTNIFAFPLGIPTN